MRLPFRLILIVLLLLTAACAANDHSGQDARANLDPELTNPDFLKIRRPRPLTQQEKDALASKTDIPFNLDVRETEDVQMFFSALRDHPDTIDRWMERAARHLPYVRAVLATYKLPPDLIALPFIESGYDTDAYSPVGAGGMWQFMPGTARRFDLTVDWWVDERRNPYLSTVAAAKYLTELYAQFGDWNLALAAYNCGEGKMSRVMNQSGQNDFFDIAKNPRLLKRETRHYVPRFLAVLKIFKNLEALGYKPVDWNAGRVMEEVTVPGGTDLAAMADACSMSWEDFRRQNPEFRRQVSPPDRDCTIYLPTDKKELALNYLKNPSCTPSKGITGYTTAAADTWANVSKRTGAPVAALRQMNPTLGDELTEGQTVYIPLAGSGLDTATMASLETRPVQRHLEQPTKNLAHKLKKGETLAALARRYGVSQADIMRANGLKPLYRLSAGHTLIIPAKAACPSPQSNTIQVKKGLTLATVAAANKVDVHTLMAANGIKSQKQLRPGMKLKIPGRQAHAPAKTVAAKKPQKTAPAPKQTARAKQQRKPAARVKVSAN